MAALAGVDDQLRLARPDLDWNGSQGFSGDQPMGLGEAAAAMADLAELDQL